MPVSLHYRARTTSCLSKIQDTYLPVHLAAGIKCKEFVAIPSAEAKSQALLLSRKPSFAFHLCLNRAQLD
jgi:hypothetical protein